MQLCTSSTHEKVRFLTSNDTAAGMSGVSTVQPNLVSIPQSKYLSLLAGRKWEEEGQGAGRDRNLEDVLAAVLGRRQDAGPSRDGVRFQDPDPERAPLLGGRGQEVEEEEEVDWVSPFLELLGVVVLAVLVATILAGLLTFVLPLEYGEAYVVSLLALLASIGILLGLTLTLHLAKRIGRRL